MLRWRKKEDNKCTICSQEEDIPHLIYECQYVQALWSSVKKIISIDIGIREIIFGDNIDCEANMLISIVVYVIYKEWLQYSYDNKTRPRVLSKPYYVNELKWFLNIYKRIQSYEKYVHYITLLVNDLS